MGCDIRKDADGRLVGIVCTRGARRQRCRWCERYGDRLCDYPVAGKTCDAPMCATHAKRVGRDKDHCPKHVELEEKLQAQREAEGKAATP